jgi:thiol-disulfide isomerase/thioredoxin
MTTKLRLLPLVLLVLLASTGCALLGLLDGRPEEMVGQPAPELTLTRLSGASVSLADFSGQVVLVNMWATWCGPCRSELPHIQDLHERYGPDGLIVLAINVGETEERIWQYITEEGYTFRVLVDPQSQSMRAFRTSGIPTTVLIDREGIVRQVQVGYAPGAVRGLEQQVQALLAEG